jgi:hypothetical protein
VNGTIRIMPRTGLSAMVTSTAWWTTWPEEDTSLAAGVRGRAGGHGSLSVGGFRWPAGNGRDYHADAGHGYEVARSGEPGVGARGGLPGDAEAFGELVAGRDRVAGRPLPGSDLSLDGPRDLEVPRDSRQVVKIIRHAGHTS